MSKYFEIDGYWKDDQTQFNGLLVREYDDIDEEFDEDIFYYGLSEQDIVQAINKSEETNLEFVITNYKEVKLKN